MNCKIGVDGGGTKTECILVDASGAVVARHTATGCNPSVVGAEAAGSILRDALAALRAPVAQPVTVTDTLLCMAGSGGFWGEFAAGLAGHGRVTARDDSRPILELATHGRAGLVLHSGTGSFVAARGPDGSVHYAGGLGWRFGDPGSGYDLGMRAVARAVLELQGWAAASGIGPAVREHAQLGATAVAGDLTRHFYAHADASRHVAALAPAVLRLAGAGDEAAEEIVLGSTGALLDFAVTVATKVFPGAPLDTVPAGLSGPILTHPRVLGSLVARSPLPLTAVAGTPIEGVRLLLMRL